MKRKLLLQLLACFFVYSTLDAQTVTGTGGAVPATGNDVVFTLNVSIPSAMNATWGLKQVNINFSQPDLTEVAIHLVSPSGRMVELIKDNPAGGPDYLNTTFDGAAATSICSGTSPYTGTYRPTGFIGQFNNGENANGNWKLLIQIWNIASPPGILNSWSLTFGPSPLTPVVLTSSNLPIIKINTGGQTIVDQVKKTMDMDIIYNGAGARNYVTDPANNYDGKVEVEYRGSSSLQFQKKSMSFETVTSTGADLDVSLLGIPPEHDWVLYASYTDKSLIRNALTYDLSKRMGHYATKSVFVELLIDGEYQGVYVLEEKIKRGSSRVNISKLTTSDNSGDQLTGGYIIRIDKRDGTEGGWHSSFAPLSGSTDTVYFQYYYPKDTVITPQQKTYLQDYIYRFEQALAGPDYADELTGYNKYIDQTSFADYFIISELSKNIDAYKVSTYLYKNRDSKGGKLKIGPVWDYDLAYSNVNYGNATDPTGWEYQQTASYYEIPFWWQRLVTDPNFNNRVKCRWEQFKSDALITPAALNARIDSLAAYLSEAEVRNFTQWPVLDANVWVNPSPVPATYPAQISDLKNWLSSRFNWLDSSLPGMAVNCTASAESAETEPADILVYPNPFRDHVTFSIDLAQGAEITLHLYDILGKEVATLQEKSRYSGEHKIVLNGADLKPGVYIYRAVIGDQTMSGKIIMQE
jgi:subtilisin-like proprotein convertase family protein